ncbi:MAG: Tol-Pal system beta propeller repeat protein TolB [Bacteriovoracia bacterium]
MKKRNQSSAFPLLSTAVLGFYLALPATSTAETTAYIPVGKAKTKKTVIAFPPIRTKDGDPRGIAKTIASTVNDDLVFMDIFSFMAPGAFIEDAGKAGIAPDTFKYSDWSVIGTDILIKAALSSEGSNVVLEAYVYDPSKSSQVMAKRYVASPADAVSIGHTFANELVEKLTGLKGIFMSRIAMVCNLTGKDEIYVMDFDGKNSKQLTRHRSLAFSPGWSPDGSKIAYTVVNRNAKNVRNHDLFEYSFIENSTRQLSNRTGMNSGADYSPDGSKIALTMSFLGNPEIFSLDPKTKTITRLTKSFGSNVDPRWSPDGSKLAFISDRTGQPMVFSMNADGSNVQRLTFAGRYNATPSWSSTNNKIAFAGWTTGHFDIFIMNPDGTKIERLTKDQGNNEDPDFSPDGNFLVFSSNRTGKKNIYVMNIDGTFVKRLTYGLGNCQSPRWSKAPK